MEIGGEEIQNGAVVAQWIAIDSPWNDDSEIAFCATRYYTNLNYAYGNNLDTKVFVYDYVGGRDGPAYSQPAPTDPQTGLPLPQTPVTVTFKNGTPYNVDLIWHDQDGNETTYKTLS